MPYSKAEQNEVFKKMTGSSKDDIDKQIADAIEKWPTTTTKLAMSMLSDAQECISLGFKVEANRKINIAKYLIDGYGKED